LPDRPSVCWSWPVDDPFFDATLRHKGSAEVADAAKGSSLGIWLATWAPQALCSDVENVVGRPLPGFVCLIYVPRKGWVSGQCAKHFEHVQNPCSAAHGPSAEYAGDVH